MKITSKYEVKQIGDELLLVPKVNSSCSNALVLNKLAAEIYRLFECNKTELEIIETLSNKYDVNIEKLKKDIGTTTDIFLQYGAMGDIDEICDC